MTLNLNGNTMKKHRTKAAIIEKRLRLKAIVLSGLLLGQTPLLLADNKQQHFTISQGQLSSVLNHFASKAGILLSADASLTRGLESDGLVGDYTTEQGLTRLLNNTGLRFTKDENNNYILQAKPTLPTQTAIELPSNNVSLDTMMVLGTPQFRYDSRQVETGNRMAKDLTEVPRSVDIIPEQLLLDSQAREMEDVYKLAPNVVNSDGYGGTREDYLIRGFRRPSDIYRNGVRLKLTRRIDPATVDNIQILKGPVADIGQMMPGGLVNIITKKPQLESENHLSTSFDEHGQRRAVFDSTGAIADSDNFAYRMTGSWEDSDTFRDNSSVDRRFLSSSLSWFGDTGGYANINYEYSREKRSLDRGVFTVPTSNGKRRLIDVSRDQRYDADFSFNEVESHLIEIDTSSPLADSGWSIDTKLFYNRERSDDTYVDVSRVAPDSPVSALPTGTLVRRVQGNRDRKLDTFFARVQTTGDFTFGVPMTIATGAEYFQQKEAWTNFVGAFQIGGTVNNPGSLSIVDDSDTPSREDKRDVTLESYGPYAQLDIKPFDDVTVTLGLREEYYSSDYSQKAVTNSTAASIDVPRESKFTKSVGLVWNIIPDLSLYSSYADTFSAQNIYTGNATTAVLSPQQGRQYEVGTKWATLNDKLLLTLAYFDIKQTNVVETVNGEPELTGGIDSKGMEFSLTGNPLPGWNIRAALGLLDAEIVSEDTDTNGNRPRNVPEKTASLWSSYEFQGLDNPLSGFGIGGGISHVGNRYGDSEHNFELGDYTLVDAGIWYYFPTMGSSTLRVDLGVKNITDEQYYTASGGDYRISVGSPRTVFGGLRLDF